MENTKVSIITVSRSIENLTSLIDSIKISDLPFEYEILCAWNGDLADLSKAKEIGFIVEYIPNYNFSKNNNALADIAKGNYLLFTNDDIFFDPDCIKKLLDTITSARNVGIVGANLRYPDNTVQHAGIFVDSEFNPYHIYKGKLNYRDRRVTLCREVPAVTGAVLLISKHEFLDIRFDERCEVAAQDVILCYEYRNKFSKKIIYCGTATAIHYENKTRKIFNQKTTPKKDMELMKSFTNPSPHNILTNENYDAIKLRIITEKSGWILHRKASEIAKNLKNARINDEYPDANIHYYINYGYYQKRPSSGIVIANFTHYDENLHSDKWISVAHEVDHCTAVSEEAAQNLIRFGIPESKITVIKVGADVSFKPSLTLGIVGRVYPGGRKGEDLVNQLLCDEQLMDGLRIISTNEGWGVDVVKMNDQSDFYRMIDYLLVPSKIEGGPVPFMEALSCGTLSIAPRIGVIPEFPHIEYQVGNIESLKNTILELKNEHIRSKSILSSYMTPYNWQTWSINHIELFLKLLRNKGN